jgi:hypothetical protein
MPQPGQSIFNNNLERQIVGPLSSASAGKVIKYIGVIIKNNSQMIEPKFLKNLFILIKKPP